MTKCTQESLIFQGDDLTSAGGVLLLRQVDKWLGLSEAVSKALKDFRRRASCKHDGLSLLPHSKTRQKN